MSIFIIIIIREIYLVKKRGGGFRLSSYFWFKSRFLHIQPSNHELNPVLYYFCLSTMPGKRLLALFFNVDVGDVLECIRLHSKFKNCSLTIIFKSSKMFLWSEVEYDPTRALKCLVLFNVLLEKKIKLRNCISVAFMSINAFF